MNVGITAVGSYVGPTSVSNAVVELSTGIPAEKILAKTGIHTRRHASPGGCTSQLAMGAVLHLLGSTPQALDDVAEIIVATSTPDQPQPSTAAILQGLLDLEPVPAWDLGAVCSGGLWGLVVGASLVTTSGRPVLVVAADRYSSIVAEDWGRAIFGDGAGAVVLGPVPEGYGLLAHRRVTHGKRADLVRVPGGGTRAPLTAPTIEAGADRFAMDGPEVRRYALDVVPDLVGRVLADAGVGGIDEVDRMVCHQANPVLLLALAEVLGVSAERVPLTAPDCGNVGAASMFHTLAETHRQAPLRSGDLVLFVAIGGGMTAGAAVMRWWDPQPD